MHSTNQFISAISFLSAHSVRLDRQAECKESTWMFIRGKKTEDSSQKVNSTATE